MAGLLVNSLDKCLKDSLLPLVPDAGTPHRATTTTVRAAQVAARALVTATMAWMLPRPLADARASLQPAAPRPTVTAAEAWSVPTKDAIIVFGSLATGYRLNDLHTYELDESPFRPDQRCFQHFTAPCQLYHDYSHLSFANILRLHSDGIEAFKRLLAVFRGGISLSKLQAYMLWGAYD